MEEIITIDYEGKPLKIAAHLKKGEQETILFIHGLGCSKDSFKDVWSFPQFEPFSVLTFDLVGFGNSPPQKSFSYTMEEHAEVCRLLIETLHLDTIHVVGHSMGGALGLLLINKMPEKFCSFCNVEGNLVGEDCGVSRKVANVLYQEFEESLFTQIKQEIKEDNGNFQMWYTWVCRSDPHAFYYSARSLVEWSDSQNLLDLFLNLNLKKVYIYGSLNSEMPVLTLIRDSVKTVPVSNSGHFMMVDNPQEFYLTVLGFIEAEPESYTSR